MTPLRWGLLGNGTLMHDSVVVTAQDYRKIKPYDVLACRGQVVSKSTPNRGAMDSLSCWEREVSFLLFQECNPERLSITLPHEHTGSIKWILIKEHMD